MASYPPKKGAAYSFNLSLPSQASPFTFQSSPTLAAGDVKVSKDFGALSNITTLPTASGKIVTVALSAAEMTADTVTVIFSDAAGSEWADTVITFETSTNQVDDLAASAALIKAKTDSLTFTQAGVVDANIQYVNDVQVKGTGTTSDPWNPV